MPLPLSELLAPVLPPGVTLPATVHHWRLDSRAVQPGDVFIAIQGAKVDGRAFIASAIDRGAAAVLVDGDQPQVLMQNAVPVITLPGLKAHLGDWAARYYESPSKHLPIIGVTGTNGKTSCTHFLAQALQQLGERCGVIGTLGSGFYGALGEPGLTTPDAVSLQASLDAFLKAGATSVAMEVSSHSIDQGRIQGIEFETTVFTNLTQDHLDYHGDMATYAGVKYRLFTDYAAKHRVINVDDAHGRAWAAALAHTGQVQAYALNKPEAWPTASPITFVKNTRLSLSGIHATLVSPWGEGEFSVPLIGAFNLSNVLAVFVSLCCRGYDFQAVLSSLKALTPVPGRMQTLGGQGKPLVVVDYAHTPDALDKVLGALRDHTEGQLACVFGCGGDRDPLKRPLMANIVERWADKVIVTNDNPRNETPEAILQDILKGFRDPSRIDVELDRSKAIQKSIQWAKASDCILIAGKGAERYQQVGEVKHPFDDVHEANYYLGSF